MNFSKLLFCFVALTSTNALATSSSGPLPAPNGNGGGFSGPDLTGSSVGQPSERGPSRDEIRRLTSDCARQMLGRFWERIYRRPFIAAASDGFQFFYEVGNCNARARLSGITGAPGNIVQLSYSKCEPGPARFDYADGDKLISLFSVRTMPFYADDGSLRVGDDSAVGPDAPTGPPTAPIELNIREFAQCLRQSL